MPPMKTPFPVSVEEKVVLCAAGKTLLPAFKLSRWDPVDVKHLFVFVRTAQRLYKYVCVSRTNLAQRERDTHKHMHAETKSNQIEQSGN